MNRIDLKFQQLRKAGKKAFIAYITAGYPSLEATEALVLALEESGADIIELGIPFSDPMADGPTIQEASFKALENGTTVRKILDMVRAIRRVSNIPLALMTYYNPVFHVGDAHFVEAAAAAGIDGLIIPDLPPDEAKELRAACLAHDVANIFFLSPTTTAARIAPIAKASTGFIYFVSVAGVTGSRKSIPAEIARDIRAAKKVTDKPVCIGFGVSTPEEVKAMANISDGVIVGSAIIKEITKHSGQKDMPARVAAFVQKLSSAL
ncbi:MAG: tryptophan synthase subunit alpha [Candidatus Omnitrophica bacterium]|nr:tryptophan synthase subunit alpha [Candidatus Omnitrophota bacterium]